MSGSREPLEPATCCLLLLESDKQMTTTYIAFSVVGTRDNAPERSGRRLPAIDCFEFAVCARVTDSEANAECRTVRSDALSASAPEGLPGKTGAA